MRTSRKLLSLFLCAVLCMSLLPTMAWAATYGDTQDHWAAEAIDRWSGYGVVNGKGEGTFDPDGQMTRAEAAQVFANLLGLNKEGDISAYPDAQGEWYSEAIAKCVAAGILNGKGAGKMDPNGTVTREEFLTMYARAVCISNGADVAQAKGELEQKGFADTAKVSDWAADAIGTLVDKGYVNGLTATELAPQANINRASVMALLNQSISTYVGKDSTETTVAAKSEGITLIANPAVTTVTGTADVVVVAAGAEKYDKETGEFEHNDIRVESAKMPIARVQGENITVTLALSTTAEDATVTETGVDSIIVIESTAAVKNAAVAAEGAKIIVKDGAKAESVTVAETAKSATVETAKNATVGTVTIAAESATATVAGKVETVKVEETAKNATIDTKSTAKVETVENRAENTAVTGTGSVGSVKSSEDVKVETKNTKVENTSETKDIAVTDSKGKESTVTTKTESTDTNKTETTVNTQPTGGGDSHSHSYTYYAISDTQHEGKCACGAKTAPANHNMVEGTCSICGYVKDSVAMIPKAEGNAAFYPTLKAAVTAVQANETVVLLKDHTSEWFGFGKVKGTVTLDLGGHTLTTSDSVGDCFYIDGCDLIVENGTIKCDRIAFYIYALKKADADAGYGSKLTIKSDVSVESGYSAYIFGATEDGENTWVEGRVAYNTVLNVEGTLKDGCIFVDGNIGNGTATANRVVEENAHPVINLMKGADLDNTVVIMNGYSETNVYDGAKVSCDDAISMKAGVLNVYGGELIGTGEKCNPIEAVNSGAESSGAGITIASTYNNYTKMQVNISGGNISSTNNSALVMGHSSNKETTIPFTAGAILNISGGTFTGGVEQPAVLVDNAIDGDSEYYTNYGIITGGTFSSDPKAYVAPGYGATKNDNETYTVEYLFAYKPDGTASAGTENDPFLIANAEQWDNFYQAVYDWDGDTIPYFKLTDDIDLTNQVIKNYAVKNDGTNSYGFFMWFDLNGNNHTLKGITDLDGYCQLFPYTYYANVHDITIDYNLDETRTCGMVYYPTGDNFFTNVTTTGSIATTADWATAYVAYMYKAYSNKNCNVTYKNCTNYANIKGGYGNDGYTAVFGSHNGGGGHITFDNCVNYGSLLGGHVGFVGMGNDSAYTFVDENAVKNYGSAAGTKSVGYFNYSGDAETKTIGGVTCQVKQEGATKSMPTDHTDTAPANFGEPITINEVSGATRYEVQMSFSVGVYNYDNGQNKDKWSGGFPRSMTFEYTNENVQAGKITTGFVKGYIGEIKANKYYGYGDTTPTYSGIFLPDDFSLKSNDVKIIERQGDVYLVTYNEKTFYVMYSEDYPGWYALLSTDNEGKVTTKNVTISFSVTAYNPDGSVLSCSSFDYQVPVETAKTFFSGLNSAPQE